MKKILIISTVIGFTMLTGCMSTSSQQRQEAYALQAEARIADERAREASKKAGIKYESPEKKEGFLGKMVKTAIKNTVPGASIILD